MRLGGGELFLGFGDAATGVLLGPEVDEFAAFLYDALTALEEFVAGRVEVLAEQLDMFAQAVVALDEVAQPVEQLLSDAEDFLLVLGLLVLYLYDQ